MFNSKFYQVKTFILTRTPRSPNYLNRLYMIFLSKIACFFRHNYKNIGLKHISLFSNSQFFGICKLEDKEKKMILVQDFARVNRFISGFEYAYSRIWDQYLLTNFEFTSASPIVIDVGANIGEFVHAAALKNAFSIYAFEPDPISFYCLTSNTSRLFPKVKLFNMALSNVSGNQKFYLASSNADSSLIEPSTYSESLMAKVTRFDSIPEIKSLPMIDLVKMDAEGAEPEVLEGLGELVYRINNFAIDVGPERKGHSTAPEVTEFFKRNKIQCRLKHHSSGRILIHAGNNILDA